MSQPEVTFSKGPLGDMAKLAAGEPRIEVALNALNEEFLSLSIEQIAALAKLVERYESRLKSESQIYYDTRPRVPLHLAINFSVAVNSRVVAAEYLRELLGEDAADLMSDWGDRIDFTKNAPDSNKATLFIDSNNKRRTTQGEDFKASGLEFADDLRATIVCAALVKKAKDAGLDLSRSTLWWKKDQPEAISQLNEAELDLLTRLRGGLVRSRSGVLTVDVNGRLRADIYDDYFCGNGGPNVWAFGASPSAK